MGRIIFEFCPDMMNVRHHNVVIARVRFVPDNIINLFFAEYLTDALPEDGEFQILYMLTLFPDYIFLQSFDQYLSKDLYTGFRFCSCIYVEIESSHFPARLLELYRKFLLHLLKRNN